VIDFIDMESRRDQLQLLEHFTQAVRHDSARPQIAQLTELGLVELTRKRQGQNIYELFGRACPSCGGLGHVAVLPGRDTLQPLATVSGLVRSAASARAEVPSPVTGESSSGGRRRRGGRGGRAAGSDASEPISYLSEPAVTMGAPVAPFTDSGSTAGEAGPRRGEPELVAVPMDADQELVYGWMGLNPALLLDPPPQGDHLAVRVVRPGADPEAILEEARQQFAASGSRRRRRGRGAGGEGRAGDGSSSSQVDVSPFAPIPVVEITPLPLDLSGAAPVSEVVTVEVPITRRRVGGGSRTAVAESPVPEAAAATEAEVDESSEPRRRRRRSSATV
jgi:ribonuclease E